MKYFQTLPTIINLDSNNTIYTLKNLLARTTLIPELSKNPMFFYKYTIQDGDTPESIAYKYYGDQYRYWLVLIGNDIFDPQFDWPLNSQQFEHYITEKYRNDTANSLSVSANTVTTSQVFAYVNSETHHYEQVIISTDNSTAIKSQKTVQIDETTYNDLDVGSETYTFTGGETVTQETQKSVVSLYDYEFNANEEKRQINIIQDRYAKDVEKALAKLMSK